MAPDRLRRHRRARRRCVHPRDFRILKVHLGLDLGGTYIKRVVVERTADGWRTLDQSQVPLAGGGPIAVIEQLASFGADATTISTDVSTVGIGVPGLYDPATGATRMLPNLEGDWDGRPVAATISAALGLPVALINDARAFGLAEQRLGAGRGASSMVGITLGTGVGGVIVLDGRVMFGHDGTCGEIGHQTLVADGLACTCGNRGCLEAYTRADRIAEVCGAGTAEEAVTLARAGDRRALEGLAEVGRFLGIGIANLIVVLTPDRVVIGGGVAAAADLLLGHIRDEIRRRVFVTSLEEIDVVVAELGTWAGAIGAAIHGADHADRNEVPPPKFEPTTFPAPHSAVPTEYS